MPDRSQNHAATFREHIWCYWRCLSWMSSYLCDCKQVVTTGDHHSDPVILKQGVPQGSVLGPKMYKTRNFTLFWCLAYGANNVGKKIAEASRKAANLPLSAWIGNITNHLWYCSKLAQGDRLHFLPSSIDKARNPVVTIDYQKQKNRKQLQREGESGLFSPQKVPIENLGDTAQSEYKHGSSLNTESSGSDSYRDILTSH
ncbi:hypothetical protein BSL78_13895, partial [Apostichopus japonicus]